MTSAMPPEEPLDNDAWVETTSAAFDDGTPVVDALSRSLFDQFGALSEMITDIDSDVFVETPAVAIESALQAWDQEFDTHQRADGPTRHLVAADSKRVAPTIRQRDRRVAPWLGVAAAVLALGFTASYVVEKQRNTTSVSDTASAEFDSDAQAPNTENKSMESASDSIASGQANPSAPTQSLTPNGGEIAASDANKQQASDESETRDVSSPIETAATAPKALWITCASDPRPLWQCFG